MGLSEGDSIGEISGTNNNNLVDSIDGRMSLYCSN